jgi:VCBS repeat-containing protein
MWGYAPMAGATSCASPSTGDVSVPGPALNVTNGQLTVHLCNALGVPTSLVIHGQSASMTPTWDDGTTGARTSATQRVRSFTHEALAGGSATYTWPSIKPGTYLYQSGTHTQVQVQMGLYGGLTADAGAGLAYAGVPYDQDLLLVYSEIDPALHAAVANGTYGTTGPTSTLNYKPKYFLINGRPYEAGVSAPLPAAAGKRNLLRFVNAGLKTHVPVLNGMHMQLVAEDGNAYPHARQQYSVFLPAGKTADAIIVPPVGTFALFDRKLDLTNAGAADGGMLAFLEATGATNTAPNIVSPTAGASLAATEHSPFSYVVEANDAEGNSLAYRLDVAPSGMSIGGNVISWTPGNTQVGPNAVRLRVSDSEGLSTTREFSVNVANVNDPPVANNDAYTVMINTAAVPTSLSPAAPGVLANDTDPDAGDTRTAQLVSGPSAGSLALNSNGSFTYTPPVVGSGAATSTRTFTYRARDAANVPSNTATVTITIQANRAPVTAGDFANAVRCSVLPCAPSRTIVIPVLNNDFDPDTAISANNRIRAANPVVITAAPSRGGTAVANANGTVSYTPNRGVIGTENFSYAVYDTLGAISASTIVRVTVK